MSNRVLAKPSGISLSDHTRHVTDEAVYILDSLPFLSQKYQQLTSCNLRKELLAAARYHDWGKSDSKWQLPCRQDYQRYREWRIEEGLPPDELSPEDHRRFEQTMRRQGKMPAPKLFCAGLRHELASLEMIERNKLSLSQAVKAAIAAHHGKLGFRHKHRWYKDAIQPGHSKGPFFFLWDQFEKLSFQRVKNLPKEEQMLNRFRYAGVRSLLQLADTRASRKEGEGDDASYEFHPFKLENKFKSLRPVQKAALEAASEPISILRAPTGSGKTYAALLWAEQQVKHGRADRLVIAMPTRFTSNALAISTAEQLSDTGLYHSSAWFNRYGGLKELEAKKEAREAHRMARYLATPVTVCTIDHLLICLTGTKEAHHSTFFFLANSAVVLDEADFYDPFVQANIVVLIEVLQTLKVPLLIMSATVPDSARQLYRVGKPIVIPKSPKPKASKKIHWLGQDADALSSVLRQMVEIGTGIIYANTVSRAFEYFNSIKQLADGKQLPIIIYHSRFTEPDKEKIEKKLIKRLGKEVWEYKSQSAVKGIAIMTQIGEMSVNISTPIMISDLCPWDRLAQRMGRLVRFEEASEGKCYIVSPQKNELLYPAPYGEYNREKRAWIASPALLTTQNQLQQNFIQPKDIWPSDFVGYVNQLYPNAPAILGHASANQREYRRLLKDNWLLLPNLYTQEEEGHVGDKWSSRHIPPQQTVFIKCPTSFSGYPELQSFALEYGVSIPVYLLEKELRRKNESRILKLEVHIEKSDEKIPVYYTDSYEDQIGLAFLYDAGLSSSAKNQMM